MRRSFVGAVTTTIALVMPSVALAADESAHDKAVAAFQEGRRLIEAGNCEAAVPKLRESLVFESSIGARLSIADCVEKTEPLQAWKLLKEAAALSLMNKDERVAVAESRATALQSRLAVITFKLPAATEQPGFELRVDGELVDRFLYRSGYATTPGKHFIEASAPGRRFTGSVNVDAGVQASVDVALQNDDCRSANAKAAALVNAHPSPTMEIDPGASRRALGLAALGIGIAGIATGVVFGLLTLDKKRGIEKDCGGSVASCTAVPGSVDAERESAKTEAAISTVSFAVGGAAILAGAALYITAPSAVGPRTGIRLSPQATRGGAGFGIGGAF
jgi:hypothetical protein